jgi:hypothetical protein
MFFFSHTSWSVIAFVVNPEQSSMPTKRSPKGRTWHRKTRQTSLLESTRSSFFSTLRHVDKEDEARKIKEVANELIVLSESTLGDGDVGSAPRQRKTLGTPLCSHFDVALTFLKAFRQHLRHNAS